MRILVVARAIDKMAGGVERMSINLMNNMVDKGLSVEFLTWDLEDATSFYEMNPDIKWHRLNLGHPYKKAGYYLMIQRARVIRSLVRSSNIDLVICFQAGTFIAINVYLLGMGIPIIASERESPCRFEHLKAKWQKSVIFHSYRFANQLVVQCESYISKYPKFLQNNIIAISNPVYPASDFANPDITNNGRYQLLSVGRLSYQKNYQILIKAFALIADTNLDWDLIIVGDGEERESLQRIINEHGLTERILLPGTTNNVAEYYLKSNAFCLTSMWEGFPNALAEALAHGLPAIGFSECPGINELIQNNKNGLLAAGMDSPSSLAKEFNKIMTDGSLRRKMGKEAIESMKKYKPDHIYNLWENLFTTTRENA